MTYVGYFALPAVGTSTLCLGRVNLAYGKKINNKLYGCTFSSAKKVWFYISTFRSKKLQKNWLLTNSIFPMQCSNTIFESRVLDLLSIKSIRHAFKLICDCDLGFFHIFSRNEWLSLNVVILENWIQIYQILWPRPWKAWKAFPENVK